MRTALHLVTVGALVVAFGQAPFAHFHDHEDWHDHDFAHVFEAPEEGAQVEAPDHDADAHAREWLAGDGTASAGHAVELTPVASAMALDVVAEIRLPLRPRSHDPPAGRRTPARAPPAFDH